MTDTTIERGDVFIGPKGDVFQVVHDGYDLRVTDPTATHPQYARSDEWRIERELLKEDLRDGTVKRASLEAVEA